MDFNAAMIAARTLARARRSGKRIKALPAGSVPGSEEEGYQIQDLGVTCYGERVGAWKVGATHPNAQAALGVGGPVAARLFQPAVLYGDQELPDTYLLRGLEAEYAFLLARDLPPEGAPYSRDALIAAVASVHPAIEIVDSRFTAMQPGPIAIADNVNDAHWLYGDGISDWHGLDLIDAPVTMEVNGEVVVRGNGAQVLGDPLASLEWLANEHAARREGLRGGQFITTGSCTGLFKAPPGCHARATFDGLGELQVRFTA